ncbi:MAG: DUF885 domain-containing protein [Novosphingobium sp.]|uniref:DUF885 domain-containing protein n=1 Tax=Novosphingobium sp. TaxID=1874826 RepID=UPI003B9BC67D
MQKGFLASLLLGASTLGASVSSAAEAGSTALAATPADAQFEAVWKDEYEWREAQQGPFEDVTGKGAKGLPDLSDVAQAARLAKWDAVLRDLAAIPVDQLSPARRVDYAVYKGQVEALRNAQSYREYEMPFNSDSSFWGELIDQSRRPFKDEKAARIYLKVMGELPRYYDQQIAQMRAGLKRGFTVPRVTLKGREVAVAQVAGAKDAESSPFWQPFAKLPASIPAAVQEDLRKEARAAIAGGVTPAHQRLLAFLQKEYFAKARTGIAASDLPDGRAYYQSKIREYVTLDRTPEQIHQIGLSEMARIRGEMAGVMREVKFEGDLKAFLTHLRTDPQFYPKKPEELLYRAAWIAKQFDGKASQYFGHLPRSRFAIKPVPDDIAPFYTSGRGGTGVYLVNTYDLPSRPFYAQVALTLHESAPGHAFQMPLAAENKDLPKFRRDTYLSAYGEGWALYCETLGVEMGMYETPYDRFGMLSYQAWRASRLVVDTGIHAKGWTREQAQAYFRENTALSDHEIETEVDRYISWPGQALSYYMGQLAILDARRKAEAALGSKFDIRAFHDAVLALGGVPLPVIDQRIDQLIADGGKGPYAGEE